MCPGINIKSQRVTTNTIRSIVVVYREKYGMRLNDRLPVLPSSVSICRNGGSHPVSPRPKTTLAVTQQGPIHWGHDEGFSALDCGLGMGRIWALKGRVQFRRQASGP